jgi:hypothetical protein
MGRDGELEQDGTGTATATSPEIFCTGGERARFAQQTSVSWMDGEHRSGSIRLGADLKPILLGMVPQR